MSGTTNVVRIVGSTVGDYGVQYAGDAHDWKAKAACRGVDPDVFYANLSPAEEDSLRAQCFGCPVLAQCEAAMRAEETAVFQIHGFRAGMTEEERRIEMRQATE